MDRKDGSFFRKYRVRVCLEGDYEIMAENEEDAFIQASDAAISGGSWCADIEEIDDTEDEE